eukprot:1158110-Pelagomonas_calceolata.AAC.2
MENLLRHPHVVAFFLAYSCSCASNLKIEASPRLLPHDPFINDPFINDPGIKHQSAYRVLALKHHPDKNNAPEAQERFKRISHAYAILRSFLASKLDVDACQGSKLLDRKKATGCRLQDTNVRSGLSQ